MITGLNEKKKCYTGTAHAFASWQQYPGTNYSPFCRSTGERPRVGGAS